MELQPSGSRSWVRYSHMIRCLRTCCQGKDEEDLPTNSTFTYVSVEIPKTEGEFEERMILKAFLLKFMNAYAPIFYVAFFKGR